MNLAQKFAQYFFPMDLLMIIDKAILSIQYIKEAIIIVLVTYCFIVLGDNIDIDTCLDAGGRWNYKNNYCEVDIKHERFVCPE